MVSTPSTVQPQSPPGWGHGNTWAEQSCVLISIKGLQKKKKIKGKMEKKKNGRPLCGHVSKTAVELRKVGSTHSHEALAVMQRVQH